MPRIDRRTFAFVRNLALLALLIAGAPTISRELRGYMGEDAFADLTKPPSSSPVAIRLEGVKFRHFTGTKLVTYADADSVDVMRDRNHVEMRGIRNGLYSNEGRRFRYRAQHAVWSTPERLLTIDGGVHVQNKDVDLRSAGVRFDSGRHLIFAEGDVKGRLAKGRLFAGGVVYNTRDGSYDASPISWSGELAVNLFQDGAAATPRAWNIKAKVTAYSGSTEIAVHTDAVATDGEIFLLSPNVVHDRKTDVVTATGRVQYFSAKANVVADSCQIFRKEKRAVFVGNVVMLAKPKKDQKEKGVIEAIPAFQPLVPDQVVATKPSTKRPESEKKKDEQLRDTKSMRDYPMVVNSAKVEYWYAKGSRRAVITGNPQGRQELVDGRWRHLWSNVGYYDGEAETLRLVSTKGRKDTRMKNSIGDDAVADWMLVSTKEEDEAFTGGGIEGDFVTLDDEDDPRGGKKPPTAPPATPPVKTGGGTPPSGLRRFLNASAAG